MPLAWFKWTKLDHHLNHKAPNGQNDGQSLAVGDVTLEAIGGSDMRKGSQTEQFGIHAEVEKGNEMDYLLRASSTLMTAWF